MAVEEKTYVGETTVFSPSLFGGRLGRMQYLLYTLSGFFLVSIIEALLLVGADAQPMEYSSALLLVLILVEVLYSVFWQLPIAVKRTHDANHGMGLVIVTFGFRWTACILGALVLLLSAVGVDNKFSSFLLSLTIFAGIASVIIRLVCFICMGFGDSYPLNNKFGAYKS